MRVCVCVCVDVRVIISTLPDKRQLRVFESFNQWQIDIFKLGIQAEIYVAGRGKHDARLGRVVQVKKGGQRNPLI